MSQQNDKLSTGLKVLCFFIPLIGLILYFVYKGESPNKSKAACHSTLWGVGVGILIQIIVMIAAAAAG